MDFKGHRLAGQRVVEVKQQPALRGFAHHAGVLAAASPDLVSDVLLAEPRGF